MRLKAYPIGHSDQSLDSAFESGSKLLLEGANRNKSSIRRAQRSFDFLPTNVTPLRWHVSARAQRDASNDSSSAVVFNCLLVPDLRSQIRSERPPKEFQ